MPENQNSGERHSGGRSAEQVRELPSKLRKDDSVSLHDKATVAIGHDIELSRFSVSAQFHHDAFCIVLIPSNEVRHDGSPWLAGASTARPAPSMMSGGRRVDRDDLSLIIGRQCAAYGGAGRRTLGAQPGVSSRALPGAIFRTACPVRKV
jgi:hypothetical protein